MVPVEYSTADVVLAGRAVPWFVQVALLSLVAAALAYASGIGAARRLGAQALRGPGGRGAPLGVRAHAR